VRGSVVFPVGPGHAAARREVGVVTTGQ